MTGRTKSHPVIINDDGWIMGSEPPLTVDGLRDRMVAAYDGTPVGVLFWCVGDSELYSEAENDLEEPYRRTQQIESDYQKN